MRETVTIRREEFARLRVAAEDLADIEAYDRAVAEPGEAIPAESVRRMVDGESPLRVFRDLRGFTQAALAQRAGVNRVQIADIEAGRKTALCRRCGSWRRRLGWRLMIWCEGYRYVCSTCCRTRESKARSWVDLMTIPKCIIAATEMVGCR